MLTVSKPFLRAILVSIRCKERSYSTSVAFMDRFRMLSYGVNPMTIDLILRDVVEELILELRANEGDEA